jgi:hypothetical protein
MLILIIVPWFYIQYVADTSFLPYVHNYAGRTLCISCHIVISMQILFVCSVEVTLHRYHSICTGKQVEI